LKWISKDNQLAGTSETEAGSAPTAFQEILMRANSPRPDRPPPSRRSRTAAALSWGALGALAGAAGGVVTGLTLFLWDTVEDGRLTWPTLDSIRTDLVILLVGAVLGGLALAALGIVSKR
jgi:hypothetical protein